ncbi:homocitrate synthase [Ethanoligenens harbinense]|nr:homocitrate synthase [Ethanoligenens harbinense YUAN-3]AYF40079.1 homocitrate synthase [Ethanoligenens harbinense]AYF42911.1 homocitrate synthase [Ethanoligenens harbinense]QCN93676.1 homocitrate synthase [Ethanoligenens harbinense]
MRDGEQRAGLAFSVEDKIACARLMDEAGIDQIEAGTPSMGIEEQAAVYGMMQVRRRARISTWNRMSESDLRASFACRPDIIHIGVPVSDIQIVEKLRTTRADVESRMKRCVTLAREAGYTVTLGFEDASRADGAFLLHLTRQAAALGVRNVRYADTVGIAHPSRIGVDIAALAAVSPVECHVHNDLGMAVANSLESAKAGALYVDTTFLGIGERAGNCDFVQFVRAARTRFSLSVDAGEDALHRLEEAVARCLRLPGYPFSAASI